MTEISKKSWGTLPSGEAIYLFTLHNSQGVETTITNYGGRVVTLKVPDRQGVFADVVLGFDDLTGYVTKNPYFGAIVGRYANRIANGEFTLKGQKYKLARNNGTSSLHGGWKGFDQMVWSARETRAKDPALELHYISKDGEEGYPGNLEVKVTYSLTNESELIIQYEATSNKETILNLTNHSYFDLAGEGAAKVLDHVVTIHADKFTPVNADIIPTGELRSVEGTPFDFRKPHAIGERIGAQNEQIRYGEGYDHNFVLNRSGDGPSFAARAVEPKSGRVLEVFTTQPGMQFYTGNHLDGSIKGKGGKLYGFRSAFCLETQQFPDAPNHPNFPSAELKAGERYRGTTIFKFSMEK